MRERRGCSTNRVREGTCTDDNDHGTHVAGTIAAKANNGVGVAGVSFNSPLAICRALNAAGSGTTAGVANCITYLARQGREGDLDVARRRRVDDAADRRSRNAHGGSGSLIIAAAGNDGDATLNYPAAYPEVVSVAATDRNDARASFSNANADVEIAARGRQRPLDQARRRLRRVLRHLDGDPARRRRGGADRGQEPVLHGGADPLQARHVRRRPRRRRAATRSSASAA